MPKTPTQIAHELGVVPQQVYGYIRSGRLEAKKDTLEGKDREQWLIEDDVAEEFIENFDGQSGGSASVDELLEGID